MAKSDDLIINDVLVPLIEGYAAKIDTEEIASAAIGGSRQVLRRRLDHPLRLDTPPASA